MTVVRGGVASWMFGEAYRRFSVESSVRCNINVAKEKN